MARNHHLLSFYADDKSFKYVSTRKLHKAYLSESTKGLNAALGIGGVITMGLGASAEKKPIRKQLTALGRLLENQGIIIYEAEPVAGKYFLARAMLGCGSMWPWAGRMPELDRVAWWIGDSANCTIFAYGSAEHLTEHHHIPDIKSTWWPSNAGTHYKLLESIQLASNSDDDSMLDSNGAKISALMDYCFNDGVIRNEHIVQPALHEILMRVDGVEQVADGLPIVYGSPLWVATVFDPFPGTYECDYDPATDVIATAVWDDDGWHSPKWRMQGKSPLSAPRRDPEVPAAPPDTSMFHSFTTDYPSI